MAEDGGVLAAASDHARLIACRTNGGISLIIATAQDAFAVFAPAFSETPPEASALAIAFLDPDRQLTDLNVHAASAGEHAELPTRMILEEALRLGASGLVIAHKRPTGEAEPTRDDIDATRELAETSARLGIRLHDHLIFAGEETCSLRAMGLL